MFAAQKVVIITERSILDGVAAIIEEKGATGYTHTAAGGKGSRGMRRLQRAAVSGLQTNVRIEVIVADKEAAEAIIEAVAERYFENYSGIAYVMPVEILRPHKFKV
ncbi:MAG: P-II family nitrogen regulator [Pseudomonadota bacterium]